MIGNYPVRFGKGVDNFTLLNAKPNASKECIYSSSLQ